MSVSTKDSLENKITVYLIGRKHDDEYPIIVENAKLFIKIDNGIYTKCRWIIFSNEDKLHKVYDDGTIDASPAICDPEINQIANKIFRMLMRPTPLGVIAQFNMALINLYDGHH
jgi:hypothetical protein